MMALFGFGKKKEGPAGEGCCGNCDAESVSGEKTAQGMGASGKVLGSGCAKCNELEANAKAALKQLGMDTEIDHVIDFAQIAAYGVMSTPALVVDGRVVAYGRVLKAEEVVEILRKMRS